MDGWLVWVLVAIAALLILAVVAVIGMVAFAKPGHLPPLRSVVDAIGEIGRHLQTLPPPSTFKARDGTALRYRAYPGAGDRIAILIHGSSVAGATMHPLAEALRQAGASVYVPDLRGHGGSGGRGDIAYAGQLEDDLADFLGHLGASAGTRRVLIGFSAGGGFTLRFAGSRYGDKLDGYVLLTPFLGPSAPTIRPDGGWAALAIPRLIGLTLLDRLDLTGFAGLPVVNFALAPEQMKDPEFTPSYSYRLLTSFGPHPDWRADFRAVTKPMRVLIGSDDEIFYPDRMGPTVQSARPDIPVTIVPGTNHAGLIWRPAALAAAVMAFRAVAGPSSSEPPVQAPNPG